MSFYNGGGVTTQSIKNQGDACMVTVTGPSMQNCQKRTESERAMLQHSVRI